MCHSKKNVGLGDGVCVCVGGVEVGGGGDNNLPSL